MTDNFPANAGTKLLRVFFAWLDKGVYTLLGFMYEIFFNVASADLFSNETILEHLKINNFDFNQTFDSLYE